MKALALSFFQRSNCRILEVSKAKASSTAVRQPPLGRAAAAPQEDAEKLCDSSGKGAANNSVPVGTAGAVEMVKFNCLCWNQASKRGQFSCPLKRYFGTFQMQQQHLELQQQVLIPF